MKWRSEHEGEKGKGREKKRNGGEKKRKGGKIEKEREKKERKKEFHSRDRTHDFPLYSQLPLATP